MDRKQQYLAEKALADRLRHSTRDERAVLYAQIYREYFELFPGEMEKASNVAAELRVIRKFLKPGMNFLEIGSGTGGFADAVGTLVSTVTTLDVASAEIKRARNEENERSRDREIESDHLITSSLVHLFFNGITAELQNNHFNLAYSNQVLEHIHPDDIDAHFAMVADSLTTGGRYIVITPHRYGGPHDASRGFARVAEGLHLHEYTYMELGRLAARHQLHTTCYYLRAGRSIQVPNWLPLIVERALALLPFAIRQPLARMLWPQVMVVMRKVK